MAFRGTFDFTLDAKNRLTVPAKFRAVLADGVVLARGAGACVEVWPQADYEAQDHKLRAASFAGAERMGDRNGRHNLPGARLQPSAITPSQAIRGGLTPGH